MNELKRIDAVVIDDLGAELGKITEPSNPTNYNLDVLTSLAEARLNKATIFTSNLNSDQMLTLYGDRIYSRIMNGAVKDGKINAFRFRVTEDKKTKPERGERMTKQLSLIETAVLDLIPNGSNRKISLRKLAKFLILMKEVYMKLSTAYDVRAFRSVPKEMVNHWIEVTTSLRMRLRERTVFIHTNHKSAICQA